MSDGPHRSLPMRRWWKQAACRADNSAFDVADCAAAIVVALERQWAEEVRPSFEKGLKDAHEEPGLFSPAEAFYLKKLNPETPLERGVLDNVAVLSPEEAAGVNAICTALVNALANEASRGVRQIEEHYLRESGPRRASRERERLDEAIAHADIDGLSRRLLQPDRPRAAPLLKKKSGLDDGVTL